MKVIDFRNSSLLEKANSIKEKLYKIGEKYVDSSRLCRKLCPACQSKTFKFAFERDSFHYIQCDRCSTIYLLDPMNLDDYKLYERDVRDQVYNTDEFKIFKKEDSSELFYDIEISASRFLDLKFPIKAGFYGAKNRSLFDVSPEKNKKIIIEEINLDEETGYDLIILNNELENKIDISEFLQKVNQKLNENGLLYITSRVGSGLDIMCLWEDSFLVPLQHINLLSVEGYKKYLEDKYNILDLSTPGSYDLSNILNSGSKNIPRFIKYMSSRRKDDSLLDFQNFIQKNLLSSYLVILAQKRG